MQILLRRPVQGHIATIAHTSRADGDLSPATVDPELLQQRRQTAVAYPWQVLRQVHSDRVLHVDRDVTHDRPAADALVTRQAHVALAVHSGDCVPVGFVHEAGAVATAHAGWKGLEAGVLESTVRALRHAGTGLITAVVGPHIRADRYEFGADALDRLAERFGEGVRSVTAQGTPALDLTAALAVELARLDIPVAHWSDDCTSADDASYWSHRARGEAGRIALVAWLEEA